MRKSTALQYVKYRIFNLVIITIFSIIFGVIFFLSNIQTEVVLYSFLLCICITIIFALYDFFRFYQRKLNLFRVFEHVNISVEGLPKPRNAIEAGYQEMLSALNDNKLSEISRLEKTLSDMEEYYSLWVHQIKTPISALGTVLQTEETPDKRELLAELFKIEQYADMALGYVRIESANSDFVIKKYRLFDIIKQVVRKYATFFIRKNITLELIESDITVLTDEKWLCFALEQVLSNALKYTDKGTISIYIEEENGTILIIKDSGIGIAEEDLPRIFEKGYTGYNGRMFKKATGIGLYLCKRILWKLNHHITISSEIDKGTTVKINLTSKETYFD